MPEFSLMRKFKLVTYFTVFRIKCLNEFFFLFIFSRSCNLSKAKHVSHNHAPFQGLRLFHISCQFFFVQPVATGYFRSHFINVTKQVLQIITSLRSKMETNLHNIARPAVMYHVSNTKCPFLYKVNRNPANGI